jgi:phage baseplate assembly protein W
MAKTIRDISDNWAYDIDKNPIDQGEIWDVDCINQSIEMILGTVPGERLFNPSFGLGLQYRIFNISSPQEAESLLDSVAGAIKTWEDRITVIEKDMRIIASVDAHTIILIVPYIINKNNIQSTFKKKIFSNS